MSIKSASISLLPDIPERDDLEAGGDRGEEVNIAAVAAAVIVDGINSHPGEDGIDNAIIPTDALNQSFRAHNRMRRWHVTFGNPALGTYAGSIVTIHPRSQRRRRLLLGDDYQSSGSDDSEDADYDDDEYDDESSESSSDASFSSSSSLDSMLQDDAHETIHCGPGRNETQQTNNIAVMVNVPPHQVPDGILNLVRGHRPFIERVRIVISSSRLEEAEYRRQRWERRGGNEPYQENEHQSRSRSQTWACENDAVDNYLTTSLSTASISNKTADSSSDDFSSSKMGTRSSRSTSLDISSHFLYDKNLEERKYDDVDALAGYEEEKYQESDEHEHKSEDKNYHIIFVLDSKDSAETFVSDLHYRPYTSLDESEFCKVYHAVHVKGEDGVSLLGPFFASSSVTTPSPNDNAPSSAKDDHQCPVCLEMMTIPSQHQSASTATTDVSSSILTTVCNHSFHIDCLARWQDSPCPVCRYDHSGLNETLSRCHVCATTVRNYVCLICGVVSCANGPSPSSPICASLDNGNGGEGIADQTRQAPSHLGHARQHYEETLHAYALDTETQHVWDFAGGGYVHRLLQNAEDGKIVEGTDPRLLEEEQLNQLLDAGGGGANSSMSTPLSSLERSTIPTYSSSADDDQAIHRKLEGFAGQYYTLLKSQLEQQRIFYEGRLEAIRREHANTTRNERQSTSDLISALKQECNNLEQRCMTLRRKHKKVTDDSRFLENMNESLQADKIAYRQQIGEAQSQLAEAKQLTQEMLGPLEEKVSMLMMQLENEMGSVGDEVAERKPAAQRK